MAGKQKQLTEEQKKEFATKLIARAWKDPQFKKLLLSNPKAALKELHIPFDANKEIRVVEEGQKYSKDENIVTIVLPKLPVEATKMSEKELAAMAGGTAMMAGGAQLGEFGVGVLTGVIKGLSGL